MSRKCVITGKKPLVGHSVSHANNKTKRRFLPNLQETSVFSDALKRLVRIKVSMSGLRTLDKVGGIDVYVMSKAKTKLEPELRELRGQIEKAQKEQKA